MKMKKIVTMALAGVMALSVFSGAAMGAETWPEKTINFACTHGAGGDTDYMARLLARKLEEKVGQSVVVNNVTGSNGAICMTEYKDGDTDGYTFVLTNSAALTGNEATGLSDFGWDAFEPVAIYGKQSGENILVPADAPYNTLEELIQASKDAPGEINFGISTGGGVYIASVIMAHAAGAEFNVIDAGDAAERLTSLLGGHVDATIAPYSSAKEYIESGDLKTLCTLLEESPDLLQDIPTANTTGCEELVMNTLYVCLAPKGTDAAIVEAANAAIKDIVDNDTEWKEEVNSFCFQEPFCLTVEETKTELENQRTLFMSYAEYLQ
ncbi:MAG: tripartite tricarboxylate transporter substrate binding protein [Lachnospiraceae bacterium]|nr:tripartite tricarboxylate transporter substrate binding protein [Lachnospiraceae bacterium]